MNIAKQSTFQQLLVILFCILSFASLKSVAICEVDLAPSSGAASVVNESSRVSHGFGVNWFRTSKLRSLMGRTDEGRAVLNAADNGTINLTFDTSRTIARNLHGEAIPSIAGSAPEAFVYLARTQNGRSFSLLGRTVSGYEHSAAVGIHEGLHALGIAGSRRAEALVRLAELKMHGISIDRTAMRQVLLDMRNSGAYSNKPWRVFKHNDQFNVDF